MTDPSILPWTARVYICQMDGERKAAIREISKEIKTISKEENGKVAVIRKGRYLESPEASKKLVGIIRIHNSLVDSPIGRWTSAIKSWNKKENKKRAESRTG